MTAATLGVRIKVAEGLPWVVTVSGFVVFAAETTGWRTGPDGVDELVLRRPGAWSEDVERRWFASGRGRHWYFWDPARVSSCGHDLASSVVPALNLRTPHAVPRSGVDPRSSGRLRA